VGVPAGGRVIKPDEALIVRDRTGARYAITGGRRLRIRNAEGALGYDAVGATTPVSPAWLDSVPPGPDLVPITITGHGKEGPEVGNRRTVVGQILVAEAVGGDNRYYVVQENGLDPVTQTEAALILGNPANDDAYPNATPKAIPVSVADVAEEGTANRAARDYPETVPKPVVATPDQTICAVGESPERAQIVVAPTVPLPAGGRPVVNREVADDIRLADELVVPPARGAIVRDQIAPTADTGTIYLLTDQGLRYPIGGPEALKALGYGTVRPVPVASNILALFPVGPLLDIGSAQREVGQ